MLHKLNEVLNWLGADPIGELVGLAVVVAVWYIVLWKPLLERVDGKP